MSKHAPGTWESDGISVRSEGADGRQIALCEITVRGRPYNETYDEAIANAHLIAAAPDLFVALKAFVHAEETTGDGTVSMAQYDKAMESVYQAALAAIAKAEGRS